MSENTNPQHVTELPKKRIRIDKRKLVTGATFVGFAAAVALGMKLEQSRPIFVAELDHKPEVDTTED